MSNSVSNIEPAYIMRLHHVEKTIGVSKSTIYSKMAKGEFPLPVQLSERAVGWRSQDIAAWLAGREAVSSTKRGVAK